MHVLLDDYYNPAFHFCEPDEGIKKQPESLGSILFGDRIFNSKFDVSWHPNSDFPELLTFPRAD